MNTPSLARRVVIAGVCVVALLALGLDLLLFFSLRSSLLASVGAELTNAATVVRGQASVVGTEALPARLQQLGVRATVRRSDGTIVAAGRLGTAAPTPPDVASRSVPLPSGGTAVVAVSRAGADHTLGRLLRLELFITPLVVLLAFFLLRLIGEVAVRPLDDIADAARRTADGERGERLRPDRVDTRLGRMAAAYDDMLDALEAAVVDSQRAQEASDRLQRHYRQVLDTTLDAFVSMDAAGRVVEWNHEAERTFGWTREEAIGRTVAETMIPPEYRASHRGELARFLQNGSSGLLGRRLENVGQRRSGQRFPMEVKAWATSDGDEVLFNSFIRDITEERRRDEQLNATLGALEKALYDSQASEVATRRFFDDAAHQLRAPITGIRACAETLMRGVPDPDDQRHLLGAVVREASRAGRLMTGLLRMARLSQAQELTLEACDLLGVCRDEADRMFYVAPHLDIFVVERGRRPPGLPELDRHAMGEILGNLLDNAARHAQTRIDVAVRWEKGRVEVHVLDDGPGVELGCQESVFDRFVSLDGRGGSGLGLPIARQLAEAHGGELMYDGKAFVLRLPLTAVARPALPEIVADRIRAAG